MKTIFYNHEKLIFFIAILTFVLVMWIIAYEINLRSDFNGLVQNVSYNEKGSPTVTINGEDYLLNYNGWNGRILIRKSDRLIKKKGSFHLFLIKFNTKDTIDLLVK